MKSKLTRLFIVYYFIIINISKVQFINERILYAANILPLIFVLIYSLKYFSKRNQSKLTFLISLHFAFVVLSSIYKMDISIILTALQMFIVIYFLLNNPISLNINFINTIFIIAIISGLLGFSLGLNKYGITPFNIGPSHSRLWRVSLFLCDNLPVSAVFSLLILLMNYFYNKHKSKLFIMAISLYFIILSASKTTIVCLAYSVAIVFLCRGRHYWKKKTRFIYVLLPIILIVILINLDNMFNLVGHFLKTDNPYILSLLNIGMQNENLLSGRDIIWEGHYRLFQENWFFGASTNEINNLFTEYSFGSESKFTYIMARDGIFGLIFIGWFIYLIYYSVKKNSIAAYLISSCLLISMFFYGSFSNGYNFGFIILLANISSEFSKVTGNNTPYDDSMEELEHA